MSWEDAFHWFTLVVLWIVIARNVWEARRRALARQRSYREGEMDKAQLAAHTGLTELQIQVAMDAAMTAFHQRIHEMQAQR
jgi:hypothetical protein